MKALPRSEFVACCLSTSRLQEHYFHFSCLTAETFGNDPSEVAQQSLSWHFSAVRGNNMNRKKQAAAATHLPTESKVQTEFLGLVHQPLCWCQVIAAYERTQKGYTNQLALIERFLKKFFSLYYCNRPIIENGNQDPNFTFEFPGKMPASGRQFDIFHFRVASLLASLQLRKSTLHLLTLPLLSDQIQFSRHGCPKYNRAGAHSVKINDVSASCLSEQEI